MSLSEMGDGERGNCKRSSGVGMHVGQPFPTVGRARPNENLCLRGSGRSTRTLQLRGTHTPLMFSQSAYGAMTFCVK